MAIIKGNSKNNILEGGTDNDALFGFAGDDILNGHDGDDRLNGGAGIDILSGGAGNDRYFVDHARDTVMEQAGKGTDTLISTVSRTLWSFTENLILTGSASINGTGNALNNIIWGNTADNTLNGNAGNDILNGFAGVDALYGGSDNDQLKIEDFNGDVVDGGSGQDVLEVYGSDQNIDLSATANLITGVETIKFSGNGHNVLELTAQSVIDLKSNYIYTLNIDGDAGDTLHFNDVGWRYGGIINNNYQVLTHSVGNFSDVYIDVYVNKDITIATMPSYTISNAASAARVNHFFTSDAQEIVIDFGDKKWSQTALSGGVIDLTGFGLEDTLSIAMPIGFTGESRSTGTAYFTASADRYHYISRIALTATYSPPNSWSFSVRYTSIARVSWQKASSTARLVSNSGIGTLQIIGLPTGLPDSHFIFV